MDNTKAAENPLLNALKQAQERKEEGTAEDPPPGNEGGKNPFEFLFNKENNQSVE